MPVGSISNETNETNETRDTRDRRAKRVAVRKWSTLLLGFVAVALIGAKCPFGLSFTGYLDLHASGVDQDIGEFDPAVSEDAGDGWTRHTFDTDGGEGPICIAGTPLSVYTREGDPDKVLFMLQGGGACWQDFYFCNILADANPPPSGPGAPGIWGDGFDDGSEVIDNPFADYSVVYVPYCDGSVFSGDNDVVDASFPFGPVRFHRGLRNATAAMDLAADVFPHARKLVVAGTSAGGVGATALTSFLARFNFGNFIKLFIVNDAGPIVVNLNEAASIAARANDWQLGKHYPASCTDCDPLGQPSALIKWRMQEDGGIKESFYSTDGDETGRFFMNIATQQEYRDLILPEHDALHDAEPDRYKRFIRSGDTSHTALQTDRFYTGKIDGVSYAEWVDAQVNARRSRGWDDRVEDFTPAP